LGLPGCFDVDGSPPLLSDSSVDSLFSDYGIQNGQELKDGRWSYGAAIEALPGIRITGRYFDTHAFGIGLSLSLGNSGFSGQSTFDKDAKHSFNTYGIRLGAYDRTILSGLTRIQSTSR
jgi:protease-4